MKRESGLAVLAVALMLTAPAALPSKEAPVDRASPPARSAQIARLAPGTPLEIVAAQANLLAMPPALIRNVQARLQNRIGVAQRGARVTLVSETDTFYCVSIECQDGKVRIEAWLEKTAARPAPEQAPPLPR